MPLSRKSFERLAKIAVAAVFAPSGLVKTVAGEGLGGLADLVYKEERQRIDQLVRKVEEDVAVFARREGLEDSVEPALATAEAVLEKGALTEAELHEVELDAARAARRVWERRPEQREGLAEGEQALVVRILEATYRSLLADPLQLEALELAFRRAVLRGLNRQEKLPEDVVETLRRSAAAALLDPGHRTWRTGEAPPSALLRAEYEIVPFQARQREMDDLARWCETGPVKGVRLYTGEGGMGKTRLMLEACRRRRSAGWRAGFLSDRHARDLSPTVLDTLFQVDAEPLFLVVDDAERRGETLGPLLDALRDAYRQRPVRLVLLARNAWKEGGWWRELYNASELLQAGSDKPIRLQPLVLAKDDREPIFRQAARHFAHRLRGLEDFENVDPAPPVPDLSSDTFDRVLYLHLRAFAAAAGDAPKASADDLLDYLQRGEEEDWKQRATAKGLDLSLDSLHEAAVLLTLAGVLERRSDAVQVLKRVPALGGQPADALGRLADLFRALYPTRVWLHGVQPDLLGESLVEQLTDREPAILRAALAAGIPDPQRSAALTVLTRIARRREAEVDTDEARQAVRDRLTEALRIDRPGLTVPAIRVAQQTGDPLGLALAAALQDDLDDEEARRIEPLLPKQTTALKEAAVVILEAALRGFEEPGSVEDRAEKARLTLDLVTRRQELRREDEVIESTEKALDLWRELESSMPEVALRERAKALNNLSTWLTRAKRPEEALEAAKESVDIRRRFAGTSAEARADLASSLVSLSNRRRRLEQGKEALEAIEEAVTLYRDLGETHLPKLALCLNNKAIILRADEQPERALESQRNCVELYRQLASSHPDAHLPYLAVSLSNLAELLADLGRWEDARPMLEESIRLFLPLYSIRRAAFGRWMFSIIGSYRRYQEGSGRDLDPSVVEQLRPVLADPALLETLDPAAPPGPEHE